MSLITPGAGRFGLWGQLVPLFSQPSAKVMDSDRFVTRESVEGRRFAQMRRSSPRTWEMSADYMEVDDRAEVEAFAMGAWGPGPFVWVSPMAQVTNVLSRSVSELDPATIPGTTPWVTLGGPVALDGGGRAPRSWESSRLDQFTHFGLIDTPVVPGMKVTGAAYVAPGASVHLFFYDALATTLVGAGVASKAAPVGAGLVRTSVTATVPAGAHRVRVASRGGSVVARPSLTWTDTLMPWAEGGGCTSAVISSTFWEHQRARASDGHGGYGAYSYTIMEVG